MRYPALQPGKRLLAAQVTGAVKRLAWGADKQLPRAEKLAELWEITRDPQIFGHVMGPFIASERPNEGELAAARLLRWAGADEAVAERNAAWQRQRMADAGDGWITL